VGGHTGFMEQDLEHLRENLRRMYRHVRLIVSRTLQALKEWRPREIDDDVAIAEELKNMLEDQATLFIARYQPLGRELLAAKSVIRVAYDLYRIARYAREINLLIAIVRSELKTSRPVIETAEKTLAMIDLAFKAYYEGSSKALEQVTSMDQEIDQAYFSGLRMLAERGSLTREEACSILILRHLERMADHAVYIASTLAV